ncbi:MAG: right-handed parallel beta-helix repeat-containing protein [Verrucomicrobia bacterium]|nr:right-handed parallel beta-helix repeat-containing protein [Verrucomicrobiota bacterium]MDA1068497.1 right-handed parallel beta-helix repeat-containing protein [Verrucomicrobiota bacterium]
MNHSYHRIIAICFTLIAGALGASAQGVSFVDQDNVSGTEDGVSWVTAFTTIQTAVVATSPGDEVWVAEGTYTGTVTMVSGISLYGGFAGTETERSARDVAAHVTVIDAAGGNEAVLLYNVSAARVDGFTITGGVSQNVRGSLLDDTVILANCIVTGSANYGLSCFGETTMRVENCAFSDLIVGINLNSSSPTFENCTSSENDYGVYSVQSALVNASPVFIDCRFTHNTEIGFYCQNPSSPQLTGCVISHNGTDGVNCNFEASPVFTDCEISNNGLAGIQSRGGSTPDFTDCVVVGNRTFGLFCYQASPTFTGCILANSLQTCVQINQDSSPRFIDCSISGSGSIGAICESSSPEFTNCVFSGNLLDGIYARVSSVLTVTNSTITGNGRHGIWCSDSASSVISNTILAHNGGYGVRKQLGAGNPSVTSCLFADNALADYFDDVAGAQTGADAINLNVPNASDNVDGDPLFAVGPAGTWTEAAAFDPATNSTTLTDGLGAFAVDAFSGRMINANTTQIRQTYVLGNTATTIEVVGDATGIAANGAVYQLLDYHLQNGSAALDRGDVAVAPAADFEGDPRPGSDDLVDIGADESPAEFTPGQGPDDTDPPFSELASLEVVSPAVFELNYTSGDSDSGVDHVELWYRHNGGAWTQYPGAFTTSPILFDSALAAGEGDYEFYTIAVDVAGNREAAPAEPDSVSTVLRSFNGARVYVDSGATGEETGMSWQNAFADIATAVLVAEVYAVPEVWVAEGDYAGAVSLPDGVSVYGGFAGTETDVSERDAEAHASRVIGTLFVPGFGVTLDGIAVVGGTSVSGAGIFEDCRFETVRLDSGSGASAFTRCLFEERYKIGVSLGSGVSLDSGSGASTFTECRFVGNGRYGVQMKSASASFFTCRFLANGTAGIGLRGGASVSLTGCVIAGNGSGDSFDRSGVHADGTDNVLEMSGCIVSGNLGPGLYIEEPRLRATLASCMVSGNDDDGVRFARAGPGQGGGMVLLGCTVSNNRGEGMSGVDDRDVLANTVFSGNRFVGVSASPLSVPVLTSCLFFGNDAELGRGDVSFNGTFYSGANAINLNVPGASGNVDGDPLFAGGPTGTWTARAVYDPVSRSTVLTDAASSYVPGELAGRLLTVSSSRDPWLQAYVLGNTATEIEVAGDLDGFPPPAGDAYRFEDYHLTDGSAALDRGDVALAPPTDFEGDPRPGTDGLVDIGADELLHDTVATPVGNLVTTSLLDGQVGLTFDQVDTGGETSVTAVPAEADLPANFQLLGRRYDISTTVLFSGFVEVCISYDDTGLDPLEEEALTLLHYDVDHWEDVSTSLDTVNNVICGVVTHFSEFVVAFPLVENYDVDGDGFGIQVDCDDNDPHMYPGAPDICDGLDNDCDGLVDEDVLVFGEIQPPINQTVLWGGVLNLSASLDITEGTTYQWQRILSGEAQYSDIQGETGTTFSSSQLTTSDEGMYRVVATNGGNAIQSNAASVSVITSAFQSWIEVHFQDPFGIGSSESDDPDMDTLSNAIEHTFGLNPNKAESNPFVLQSIEIINNEQYAVFTYLPVAAGVDFMLSFQGNAGLDPNAWSTLQNGVNGVIIESTAEGNVIKISASGPRFTRVKITTN